MEFSLSSTQINYIYTAWSMEYLAVCNTQNLFRVLHREYCLLHSTFTAVLPYMGKYFCRAIATNVLFAITDLNKKCYILFGSD